MPIKKQKSRLDKTLPDVRNWAKGMSEWPTIEPIYNDIQNYVNHQAELFEALSYLHKLGMAEVANSLLVAGEYPNTPSTIHMAHGFSRMIHANGIDILELKGQQQTIVVSLDTVMQNILGAIALGMPGLARKFHRIVLDGLEQGYGIKNGHNDPGPETLRYAAMGLSIIHDWLKIPLDLDKPGLPRDPAWGPLVSHWNDPDPARVQAVLYSACDIHIERIALTEREVNTGNFEFASEFTAVHPTEILAVLRLREMLGLMNPVVDHPLMNTPYAHITATPGQVTEPDTLLDKFLNIAREREPQLMAQWDSIQVN